MGTDSNTSSASRLLIIGAFTGAVLAASGLLENSGAGLAQDQVALVNNEPITKSDFLGYLDLLARDKRNPMTAADRRHVLDRVIEEKLLVARGLQIDLPYSDPKVRKTIVNAMIQVAITDVSGEEPTEEQLQDFYQQNLKYFATPDRIALRRMVFRGEGASLRASRATAALPGQSWSQVQEAFADEDILALPGAPLPVSKLRGYLGPSLTQAAMALTPGQVSAVLPDQSGFTILQLLSLEPGTPPPLQSIREQVTREFQRRAGDQALRDYLAQLRSEAELAIDSQFLEQLDEVANARDL
jgi:parvulin-like peptidyl-prolyl isomerase